MATTISNPALLTPAAPTGKGSVPLEARPFSRLAPAKSGALAAQAVRGLQDLRAATEDAAPALAAALVRFSFRHGEALDLVTRKGHTASILNRRRRSARLWINSILGGHWDLETIRTLRRVWLPQLAGTGHYAHRARGAGLEFVEYLRGAITAWILDEPDANLVPCARALHSLDSLLAVHLRGIVEPSAAYDDAPRS